MRKLFLITAITLFGAVGIALSATGPWWYQIHNMQSIMQGCVLYGGSDGEMRVLPPGTSGYVLQTLGAGANPQWVYVSNVAHPVTWTLTPEMSGGWKFTSDGTSNSVIVYSYHDPTGIGNGSAYATHLSYEVRGETDLQDLDVYCYAQLPANFGSWQSGACIGVESWVSTLSGSTGITEYLYDGTNTVDSGCSATLQRNTTWLTNWYTPAGTYAAGDWLVFKFRVVVDNGTRARIGTIQLKYNALW